MALSNDLMSQFAKLVTSDKSDKNNKQESTVYGTVVEYEGSKYVRIDGSSFMTPMVTTSDVAVGERVTVMIKNHLATVTGNISSPSARTDDVALIGSSQKELADRIVEFEGIVADVARIDQLEVADVAIKNRLTANEADITTLKADNVAIKESLTTAEADIGTLTAGTAEIKGSLTAAEADITELQTNKLDAETARVTYANIDFSNIGKAAMEYFYAQSGLIQDVTVGDATIAGKLVGVTISGDLIEGNTIVAEKLVVKGEDGLYYKLNTDGITVEAEQTDYNSLNGQIIKAQSITASKIAVDDLVAFDATIGGFNITDRSIYSGVKESVDNTTRGIYLDNSGQVAFGDESNYLKYYRDQNGAYKLEISAASVVFKSGTSVEEAISAAVVSSTEEFYQSNSPTALSGGTWSETVPTWTNGKYIWRRTKVEYGNGYSEYTPSVNGICISGNTGLKGDTGESGKGISSTAVTYQAGTSGTVVPTGTWSTTIPTVSAGKYLWTKTVTAYTDGTTTTAYSVGMMGATGSTGATGAAGKGVSSTVITYQKSSSGTTAPTGTWSSSVPSASAGQYIWTRTIITYTDGTTSTSYSVGMIGATGATGAKGDKGDTGATGAKGDKGDTGATGAKGDPGIDFSQGKMLNNDPMFATGSNGCSSYNNKSNGTVTVTRSTKSSDNPMTGTNYELVVKTTGEASPGIGGYYQNISSRANAIFVRRIIAKVPVGYNVTNAQNNMGDGYNCTWLTSQAGTGKFTEYIYKYTCGTTGTFSTGGHVYLAGTAATASAPVTWYVAYSTTFDMTNVSDISTAREEASEAAKTATNYMAFNDVATGLVIGDMTANTLGKNVLIDSDSVDIRNGSTVLASFGEDHVTLGRNAEESYIDLCDGAGRISANTAEASTSYPNRNAILIDSQEIETESVRFVATVSNGYGLATAPNPKKYSELYMLRDSGSSGTTARLKSEHWNTSTGKYINAGFVGLTYDDTAKTYASIYVSDSINSVYNSVKVYKTKTTTDKSLFINGIEFSGSNKVLWSGGYYMSDTQTATLSQAISAQANGVVLLWSYYVDGAVDNSNFQSWFVPKHFVELHSGKGITMVMSNGTMNVVASKYVYVSDTTIKGHANNDDAATSKTCGLTSTPKNFVLRYVIGV